MTLCSFIQLAHWHIQFGICLFMFIVMFLYVLMLNFVSLNYTFTDNLKRK